MLSTCNNVLLLYPHFIDEDTEAQKDETHPRPQNSSGGARFETWCPDPKACAFNLAQCLLALVNAC